MAFVTVPSFSIFEVLEHVNVVMVASSLSIKDYPASISTLEKVWSSITRVLISSLLISALSLAVELVVKSFELLSNFIKLDSISSASSVAEVILRLFLNEVIWNLDPFFGVMASFPLEEKVPPSIPTSEFSA